MQHNAPEAFRSQLRKRTPEAIAAVRWVAETTRDPRIYREAREYLRKD